SPRGRGPPEGPPSSVRLPRPARLRRRDGPADPRRGGAVGGGVARLLRASVTVPLLVLLGAGGAWHLRGAAPQAGEERLPGLSAPVEVWRDSLDVPYLRAASEA